MRYAVRLIALLVVTMVEVGLPVPAAAVEYRLNVVNLYEGAFAAFLGSREWNDGAAGPGLNRLEASLDQGAVGKGNLLYDRPVQPAPGGIPRARGGGAGAGGAG